MSFIRRINSKLTFLLVISAVALALAACSAPVEKLNQDGNEAFAEQAYLEALELYQSAQIESPELAEPYFNAANTFYRQGDFPAALEQMQMALQYVDEESLAESSFYNMGNTLFNSQDLGTAVEAYKQALLLDPADQDAKYNLELALQQQEQQEQQQEEQQQQQQEQEQQGEQNQDQGEESQDQSQEGQGEDQESQQEESEDPQNGENQDDNSQDQEGDQSQNNDQQNGDQESEQENGSGAPQDSENQQSADQPSQVPPPGQRMTEEQAQQLLAAIADDTQTLQEKLGQYLFSRQAPPAQDW